MDGAELALKAFARDNGPEENSYFTVSVQAKARRWLDTDVVLTACPWVWDIPGVVVKSIEKSKIEALAKSGMIPEAVVAEAQRAEQLTAAVTVKPKKEG